jgi:hypothetical protein
MTNSLQTLTTHLLAYRTRKWKASCPAVMSEVVTPFAIYGMTRATTSSAIQTHRVLLPLLARPRMMRVGRLDHLVAVERSGRQYHPEAGSQDLSPSVNSSLEQAKQIKSNHHHLAQSKTYFLFRNLILTPSHLIIVYCRLACNVIMPITMLGQRIT